jgi:hypothetical protein
VTASIEYRGEQPHKVVRADGQGVHS